LKLIEFFPETSNGFIDANEEKKPIKIIPIEFNLFNMGSYLFALLIQTHS
jgi:hypothetical protein